MFNSKSKAIKILPTNKTVVLYSPLEENEVLVRTGTIGDGSCFFHSILHAYSKKYALMDNDERCAFVHHLRTSMAGNIDKDKWEALGDGLISKIQFQEKMNSIISCFYKFIRSEHVKLNHSEHNIMQILNEVFLCMDALKI